MIVCSPHTANRLVSRQCHRPTDSPAHPPRSSVAVVDQSGLAKDQVVIADVVLDLQRHIVTWPGPIDGGVIDLQ
jgi:hypothetical protein